MGGRIVLAMMSFVVSQKMLRGIRGRAERDVQD
jgi:hypothetical protein